ncbi:MAG: alpha/beta hydrolase fold family protein, partial [Burkholderiales bacterium]|nr:alpha/beta hydrolase fold family protein [Burkholderiales bacterium]
MLQTYGKSKNLNNSYYINGPRFNNVYLESIRMQSSFMKFEFGELHYQHFMSGKKTTILFLHAFHSSAASYSQVCDVLKDQFNVVCMDFPGHGLSAHVNIEQYSWYYSLEGFTAVMLEFINNLKLENLF